MFFVSISYHYVGNFNTPHAGIHALAPEAFQARLAALGGMFTFVSSDDLAAAIQGRRTLPERCCLVTFDDGLLCHYETVLPIIGELHIPAVFYVIGMPLAEGRASGTHKTHWLRAHIAPGDFLARVQAAAGRLHEAPAEPGDDMLVNARQAYRYDEPAAALLKYYLNYVLSSDACERIIDDIFQAEHGDEAGFCRQWYMDRTQLRELAHTSGCAVGVHGYRHRPLALMTAGQVADELHLTRSLLAECTGAGIASVSYPFGNQHAVSRREGEIAAASGFSFGLTMERSFNRTLSSPHLLARLDANDAPLGKAPAFSCEAAEPVPVDGRCALYRNRYIHEQSEELHP